jgi:hypothetical protein
VTCVDVHLRWCDGAPLLRWFRQAPAPRGDAVGLIAVDAAGTRGRGALLAVVTATALVLIIAAPLIGRYP